MQVLFTFQHIVERGTIDNLTFVMTQSLMQQGRLIEEEVCERLIWFNGDGIFFLRMSHWNDISIEEKTFFLRDAATLYGP